MKERLGSHPNYHDRHLRGQRGLDRASRAREGQELSPRDAVLHRVCMGRPDTSKRWGGIATAVARYEPAVDMFAIHIDWSAETVWRSAIGPGPTMPVDLRASHILAIIDLSVLWAHGKIAGPGAHNSRLTMSPTWENGVRTTIGAQFDDEMPGLNIVNWRRGVDRQFHRRYFVGDG